ncbi:uncharacterized protein VTP21DRAFT_8856 [Calcarisporiella thermophila]|uniref:uncharacterized protein n=1 Tax=Calcarisporiella thermophila TaxID=911321 RepID=UPI003742192D
MFLVVHDNCDPGLMLQTLVSCSNMKTWLIEDLLMEPVKPPPKVHILAHSKRRHRRILCFGSLGRLGQLFQALPHAPSSVSRALILTPAIFRLWVGNFLESVKAGILLENASEDLGPGRHIVLSLMIVEWPISIDILMIYEEAAQDREPMLFSTRLQWLSSLKKLLTQLPPRMVYVGQMPSLLISFCLA